MPQAPHRSALLRGTRLLRGVNAQKRGASGQWRSANPSTRDSRWPESAYAPRQGASVLPDGRILLAVLEVRLGLDQLQRLAPDLLIRGGVIQVAQVDNDIVADERAVLLDGALREAPGQPVDHQLLLLGASRAHLPQRLQRVPGRDKHLVVGDGQHLVKVLEHALARVALARLHSSWVAMARRWLLASRVMASSSSQAS